MFKPIIKQAFIHTFNTWGFTPKKFDTDDKMDTMMDIILKDMCQTRHRLYVPLPDIWDTMNPEQ